MDEQHNIPLSMVALDRWSEPFATGRHSVSRHCQCQPTPEMKITVLGAGQAYQRLVWQHHEPA